jgi:putative transposase
VADGQGVDLWAQALNKQTYLGDDDFVERMQQQSMSLASVAAAPSSKAIPKAQRSRPRTLVEWLKECPSREEALRCAYVLSGISMRDLAREQGLTVSRVSQLIARAEKVAQATAG